MPTWTPPVTWIDGQLVGASALNTQLRDNMNALMNPNNFVLQGAGPFSTTASTFSNITSTALVVQGGGPVEIAGQMPFFVSNLHSGMIVVDVDGVQVTVYSGAAAGGAGALFGFNTLWTGLTVGSHTVSLKWKVEAGQTGATTGNNANGVPLNFYGIER